MPTLWRRSLSSPLPVYCGKRHLPQPRGPHSVGFVDLMTPGGPDKGVFVRVLYPTAAQCLDENARWPQWKEDPYLTGLLNFMQITLAKWPSWAPKTDFHGLNHVSKLSPLIPHAVFPTIFRLASSGRVHVPILEGVKPLKRVVPWPLVVFSHGLGCARTTYSRLCYDLASYGFIVAAVEHRDGSACASYYVEPGETLTRWIPHKRISNAEDEYEIRNSQVHHRSGEVSRALDLLCEIKAGNFPAVVNSWDPEVKDENGAGVFTFSDLKAAMNIEKPVIMGHSFGGATSVLSLAKDPRFSLAVALDAWLFPLRDERLGEMVPKHPLMFISTDTFRSDENLAKMSELRDPDCDRKFLFLKGSIHQNHLDAPFVFGNYVLLRKVLGMYSQTCPEVVMDLTVKQTVKFFSTRLTQDHSDEEIDRDLEANQDLFQDLFE